MKIDVDRSLCQSIGNCEAVAPDWLQVDDEGSLEILRADVPPADVALLERAVTRCPTGALRLVD